MFLERKPIGLETADMIVFSLDNFFDNEMKWRFDIIARLFGNNWKLKYEKSHHSVKWLLKALNFALTFSLALFLSNLSVRDAVVCSKNLRNSEPRKLKVRNSWNATTSLVPISIFASEGTQKPVD
ncbi:hypothetical protein GPALN_005023 [Globodera pallida]|nr:hypothetical protein GPALN_005023 [Globodera pallida]